MACVIETKELTKVYSKAAGPAVENLNLTVEEGEIFGFLGPNGAGKTTTVLLLTTLTKPSAGEGKVCGHSIVKEPERVRQCIGYCPQEISVDEELTARENLLIYARLCGLSIREAKARIGELFELMELVGRENELIKNYSSGMRRRLELAGTLIHSPKLLMLDEPTLGLDPQFRQEIWQRIREVRAKGSSVFITTHYLDEADALCDRVAIINDGQIKVVGNPSELKEEIGDVIQVVLSNLECRQATIKCLRMIPNVKDILTTPGGVNVFVQKGEELVPEVIASLSTVRIQVNSISFARASLDHVFLRYSGQRMHIAGSLRGEPN